MSHEHRTSSGRTVSTSDPISNPISKRNPRATRGRRTGSAGIVALALAVAACGGDNDDATTSSTASPTSAATEPSTTTPTSNTTAAPTTAAPTTAATTTVATTSTTVPATTQPDVDPLAAAEPELQAIIDAAMEPGAISWDCCGVEAPPTLVNVGIRIAGSDDLILGSGTNVDGSPVVPGAAFPTATLTTSLIQSIAFQLVDEGLLDPGATVDAWAPMMPNASQVTVQMLLDGTTGWGVVPDDAGTANILADLERAWTLDEVVAELSSASVEGPPGTLTVNSSSLTGATVLGFVLEEVTGESLAALVESRITEAAGLTDTHLTNGAEVPAGFQYGVFVLDGVAYDTSQFPGVAYYTYNAATQSALSTIPDLLDLLDVWESGELFTTDRTSSPSRFTDDRVTSADERSYVGLGVPFIAYCPCSEVPGGHVGKATGRTPGGLDTVVFIWKYADGVSIVLHFNSNELNDNKPVGDLVDELHGVVTSAMN